MQLWEHRNPGGIPVERPLRNPQIQAGGSDSICGAALKKVPDLRVHIEDMIAEDDKWWCATIGQALTRVEAAAGIFRNRDLEDRQPADRRALGLPGESHPRELNLANQNGSSPAREEILRTRPGKAVATVLHSAVRVMRILDRYIVRGQVFRHALAGTSRLHICLFRATTGALDGALCASQRFRRAGAGTFSLHIPCCICIYCAHATLIGVLLARANVEHD